MGDNWYKMADFAHWENNHMTFCIFTWVYLIFILYIDWKMAESNEPMNEIEEGNSVEDDTDVFDEMQVARNGISKLLNNNFDDAFKLFQQHK